MKQGSAWLPGPDGKLAGARQPRSITGQLLVAVSVAAVLIGGAAAGGYLAAARQEAAVHQLAARYQVLAEAADHLETSFLSASTAVRNYALTGQASYLGWLTAARAGYQRNLSILQQDTPPGLRGLVAAEARAGALWFGLLPQLAGADPHTPVTRALVRRSARLARGLAAATARLQQGVSAGAGKLASSSRRAYVLGLAWTDGALAAAVLLVLAAALSTLFTVTRPLRRVAATVQRLTAGDHGARAPVAGTAEVRAVAQSVNAQADEAGRLRAAEAESGRLRALAREAGLRIRERLAPDDVLAAARDALDRILDADLVYLRLLEGGRFGPPLGCAGSTARLAGLAALQVTPATLAGLRSLLRTQSSQVVQDLAGPAGAQVPAPARQQLLRAGVVAHLATPFGVGADLLGVIVACRCRPGRPWSPAEIDAAESVAADLGRGLSQARLYEEENLLVQDLRALDQLKSDFFATVSHELRAPLTTIEGYVEMLADGEAGEITGAQRKMLETIARSSARLRGLVEDLLTLSKLESGAFDPVPVPVDLAEVISDAVDAIYPSAVAAQLTVGQPEAAGPLTVNGHADQLDRVMANLLSNAVKYTPAGGRIEVSAAAEGEWAVIRVADTGIGIPERDRKELFTRFARASNATARRIPGTGLGLVIVQVIVRNHGGEVDLESAEGEGTTVTVRLPLAPSGASSLTSRTPGP
jgi:two-component system phosphate regulon sensor histidine kinase PhoR